MKILWLSNYRFRLDADVATGTWMGSMGYALTKDCQHELFNITHSRFCCEINRADSGRIKQWVLPEWKVADNGLPASVALEKIKGIIQSIRPDVIHVWGMESSYFPLLVARGIISKEKTILDIQGIQFVCADYFVANLTIREQLSCLGVREIFRNTSPISSQAKFHAKRVVELEVLRSFKNIAYQSEWAHDYLKILADPQARLHATRIMLRDEFVRSERRWRLQGNKNVIFSLCACGKPYKGAHVLIRALAYLKNCDARYRDIRLILGGGIGHGGIRKIGYVRFLENEIKRFGLKGNVRFLGALTAEQIREQLLNASVFVHPSFIESYSLTVAEAMAIGTPCVVSNAGAMPELAVDGESALYFPSGDAVLCAERIRRILESDELAERLSKNAVQVALKRNDPEAVVKRQMEIYENLI